MEVAAIRRLAEFGLQPPWQAFVPIRLHIHNRLVSDPDALRSHRRQHNGERVELRRHALATRSHCDHAQAILAVLGLQDSFTIVATRDDG